MIGFEGLDEQMRPRANGQISRRGRWAKLRWCVEPRPDCVHSARSCCACPRRQNLADAYCNLSEVVQSMQGNNLHQLPEPLNPARADFNEGPANAQPIGVRPARPAIVDLSDALARGPRNHHSLSDAGDGPHFHIFGATTSQRAV